MKKIMLLLAMVLMGSVASAASGPVWSCGISANLQGKEIGLVVSVKELAGSGVIKCTSVNGDRVKKIPVRIYIKGYGAGVGFSETRSIKMRGIGLGVVADPKTLARNYKLGVSSGASLVRVGIGFDAAFMARSGSGGGFEFGLSGQDVRGLSLGVHLQKMKISLR